MSSKTRSRMCAGPTAVDMNARGRGGIVGNSVLLWPYRSGARRGAESEDGEDAQDEGAHVCGLSACQCRLLARGMFSHLLKDKFTAEVAMRSSATERKVLSALTRSGTSLEEVTERCCDVGSNQPVFLVEALLI